VPPVMLSRAGRSPAAPMGLGGAKPRPGRSPAPPVGLCGAKPRPWGLGGAKPRPSQGVFVVFPPSCCRRQCRAGRSPAAPMGLGGAKPRPGRSPAPPVGLGGAKPRPSLDLAVGQVVVMPSTALCVCVWVRGWAEPRPRPWGWAGRAGRAGLAGLRPAQGCVGLLSRSESPGSSMDRAPMVVFVLRFFVFETPSCRRALFAASRVSVVKTPKKLRDRAERLGLRPSQVRTWPPAKSSEVNVVDTHAQLRK